jgi:hypothetical protein
MDTNPLRFGTFELDVHSRELREPDVCAEARPHRYFRSPASPSHHGIFEGLRRLGECVDASAIPQRK